MNKAMNKTMSETKPLYVNCPGCHQKIIWSNTNVFRPFCSESCKNKDFVGWANEEKRLSGSEYDDLFSEDSHP